MTGRLTTHVLDTATGRPAAGMALSLFRLTDGDRHPLGQWVTNTDGRCDAPLLEGPALTAGVYELVFAVDAGFYTSIPIRFRVTDPTAHHHVPLILAPHGYTTYRGS